VLHVYVDGTATFCSTSMIQHHVVDGTLNFNRCTIFCGHNKSTLWIPQHVAERLHCGNNKSCGHNKPCGHNKSTIVCIGCLKLQVSFCKRATNYRVLLRKMTYEEKASYASLTPCTILPSINYSIIRVHKRLSQPPQEIEPYLTRRSYYHALQHTATHCNTLQHTATHCNTLQRSAT